MCELCNRGTAEIRQLKQDGLVEDSYCCEWTADPPDFETDPDVDQEDENPEVLACSEPARWLVVEHGVAEHLCEAHAIYERELDEEGVDTLRERAGLDSGTLLSIEADEVCDYFDHLDPTECKPAKYARWVRYQFLFCDEHIEEFKKGI